MSPTHSRMDTYRMQEPLIVISPSIFRIIIIIIIIVIIIIITIIIPTPRRCVLSVEGTYYSSLHTQKLQAEYSKNPLRPVFLQPLVRTDL